MKSFEQIAMAMYKAWRDKMAEKLCYRPTPWESAADGEKEAWLSAAKAAHKPNRNDLLAKKIDRLHARVQELEAMLDAVGAGGVSAQRVTQAKDHIAHPLEMVAAPVVLPEPVAAQFRFTAGPHNWQDCTLGLAKKYQGLLKIEIRYLHTEQQVRDLLAKAEQRAQAQKDTK